MFELSMILGHETKLIIFGIKRITWPESWIKNKNKNLQFCIYYNKGKK